MGIAYYGGRGSDAFADSGPDKKELLSSIDISSLLLIPLRRDGGQKENEGSGRKG